MANLTKKEQTEIIEALNHLTSAQQQWIKSTIIQFGTPRIFWRAKNSDIVSQEVLENFGDRLLSHHANSRQALTKDRFEFAFEAALTAAGIKSALVKSRTNRGHDIDIREERISLKTEAAKGIKESSIHVSKWMELGKGVWDLELLRRLFLDHMKSYDRIFTLRCLSSDLEKTRYELVEIPKGLLLECETSELEVAEKSKQTPKPGYCYVRNDAGTLKFALYFDGGSERKLQIKAIDKSLCKIHATWTFGSAAAE